MAYKLPPRRWPWILGGIALFVVFALVLPVFSTLQPAYYARYDNTRLRMQNWRTSTHAKVGCAECHVDPGAAGFLTFAARSVPAFYSQLVFGPTDTNLLKSPTIAACQKCHTAYRQVSPAGDLLIPHRAHVEVLKVNCATCHKNLVHSKNAAGYNRPEMQTCLKQCHDGTKASNECIDCHTQKQTPASHREKGWLETHASQTESVNCAKCHEWSPDYCKECHKKRPATHAGNWKTDHKERAKTRAKGCLFCHGEAFCKKCHD